MKPHKKSMTLHIATMSDSTVSLDPIKRTSNTSSSSSSCYSKTFQVIWGVWNCNIIRDDSLYSPKNVALLDFWTIV
jgi:hypothetical protein